MAGARRHSFFLRDLMDLGGGGGGGGSPFVRNVLSNVLSAVGLFFFRGRENIRFDLFSSMPIRPAFRNHPTQTPNCPR